MSDDGEGHENAGDTVNAPLTPQGGEDDVSKLGKKKFMVSDKQTKMNPDDDVESTQAPTLTAKDLEFIAKFSQHSGADIVRTFVHSLCPQIFGHDVVKLGLLLCLFGGVRKSIAGCGKVPTRGSLHCLIVGDPGLGKSQMLKAVSISLLGRFTCAVEQSPPPVSPPPWSEIQAQERRPSKPEPSYSPIEASAARR